MLKRQLKTVGYCLILEFSLPYFVVKSITDFVVCAKTERRLKSALHNYRTMKYLIVGLGNIGSEYKNTRHNVGFMAVDKIAESKGVTFETKRYADIASFKHKGRAIHLIKPSTFMNLSGKAVRHWLTELKIEIENCLVIVDDLALPLETLRMRKKGSDAGHNGLKNIQDLLQTQNYPRLRVGIGDNFSKGKQIDFVLGEFDKNESAALPLILDKIEEMTLSFCTIGIDRTMSQYNS